MWQRHGHVNKIFVVKGQTVKKGDIIATVGNGNGQYKNASHDHADFPNQILNPWTSYVFGISKEGVRHLYSDPKPFRKICAPWYDHLGWGYLDYATYGTNHCYHPGEDWNGKGAGDSDFDFPIYSAFDSKVVYIYDGTGSNGGWGKLIVLKEIYTKTTEPMQTYAPAILVDSETPQIPVKNEPTSPPIPEVAHNDLIPIQTPPSPPEATKNDTPQVIPKPQIPIEPTKDTNEPSLFERLINFLINLILKK
jgi:hypothetical protein